MNERQEKCLYRVVSTCQCGKNNAVRSPFVSGGSVEKSGTSGQR